MPMHDWTRVPAGLFHHFHQAYIEPVAVGDDLPEMALFLGSEFHVLAPLETTYRTAWEASPLELRTAVESGVMPESGTDT